MDKNSIYVSLFNSLIGIALTVLVKGAVMIGGIICIAILTILWIERKWIYENIFKRRISHTITGYAAIVLLMAGVLTLLSQTDRDTSLIVKNVQTYLSFLNHDKYKQAYPFLSELSKKNYSADKFVDDHEKAKVVAQDFRINKVVLNEFDDSKALVEVSSPFNIYGQASLNLEMVKEKDEWHVVLNPQSLFAKAPLPTVSPASSQASNRSPSGSRDKDKKESGKVGKFFKGLF